MFTFIYLVSCVYLYSHFYDMVLEEEGKVDAVMNVTAFIAGLFYPLMIVAIISVMVYQVITNR